MTFDLKSFESAALELRTADVSVPALWPWFDIPEEHKAAINAMTDEAAIQEYVGKKKLAVWRVRGLNDDEIERSRDNAQGQRQRIAEILQGVMNGAVSATDDLKSILGSDGDMHMQVALRCEHIAFGSIDPSVSIQVAAKLARNFPIEFRSLARKIMELSGLGAVDSVKSKPSGTINESDSS